MVRERREKGFSGRCGLAGLGWFWIQISNSISHTTCRNKMYPQKNQHHQHQNTLIWITTEPPMSQYPLAFISKASSLVTLPMDFSRHRFSLSDPAAKDFISLNNRTTDPVYFPLKPCPRGQVYRQDNTGQKIMSCYVK